MNQLKEHLSVIILLPFILLLGILGTIIVLGILPTHIDNPYHGKIIDSLFVSKDLSFLTIAEQEHMRDVALLTKATLLLIIVFGLLYQKFPAHEQAQKKTALAIFSLLGIGILSALLFGFATIWRGFHYVFFPQGNWTFPQESILLTLYPQTYFMGSGLLFVGILCLLCIWLMKK